MTLPGPTPLESAAYVLGTYLVHSTLIVALVWLLQLRAGARLRDWLWKAAFLLPLATTAGRALSLEPSFAPAWRVALPALGAGEKEVAPLALAEAVGDAPTLARPTLGLPAAEPVARLAKRRATPSSQPIRGLSVVALLFVLWLGVAVLLPGFRARRFLRAARPLTAGSTVDELAALQRRSGMLAPVHLYEHDELGSPVAAGWLHRGIYVPPRASALDPATRQALLAHELAHHSRLDPLWNSVTHVLTVLLFFQPLLRVARARLKESAEWLADDLAVRWTDDGASLAHCLTEVAGWISPRTVPLAATVPMVRMRKPGRLRARVQRALEAPREVSALFSVPAALALALVAWCAMPSLRASELEGAATPENPAAKPYLEALRRSQMELEALDSSKRKSKTFRALQAELDQLTQAARAATSQE